MQLIFMSAFVIFGVVLVLFSLGVIFSNKRIRGSCGGVNVLDQNGEPLNCATCPNRDKNPDCSRRKEQEALDPIEDSY